MSVAQPNTAPSEAPEDVLARFARYASDPWAFLTECVYTQDQADSENPVKRFPSYPYLKLYVRLWEKRKLIAVPKSRRMTMSWTNIALYLWDTIFHATRLNGIVSKKEDDAVDLINRAQFIFNSIPADKIPRSLLPRLETRAKPPSLTFPELDSKLMGFPMGANQMRQYTFSGIMGDECAFWEEAQAFYSSAAPTIEGGGRLTLISSRAPGFFQRLVYDRLDEEGPVDEEAFPAPHKLPFGDDSVRVWVNPKNGFTVFDPLYTANPTKRDPIFRETMRRRMPIKDFLVEYERNWEAFEGKPVFEDYDKSRHESRTSLDPHLGLPLLLGWDFGLTPACVVAQLRGSRLIIIREFVAEHASISKFCPEVLTALATRYPQWNDPKKDFRHYIDPAGLAESQVNQRTCAQEMFSAGCRNLFPGPITWEARRKAVEHFLITHTKEGAGLALNPSDCPTLSKGFAGGYVYPERYQQIEPGRPQPIKNRFSHPHDALQYLAGGALSLLGKAKTITEIPIPAYTLTQEHN